MLSRSALAKKAGPACSAGADESGGLLARAEEVRMMQPRFKISILLYVRTLWIYVLTSTDYIKKSNPDFRRWRKDRSTPGYTVFFFSFSFPYGMFLGLCYSTGPAPIMDNPSGFLRGALRLHTSLPRRFEARREKWGGCADCHVSWLQFVAPLARPFSRIL